MKEKERYEFGQRTLFYSGEELTTFDGFNLDDFMRIICKLLNQQDKEIIKLIGENKQLKQSQKQLAISELEKIYNLFEPYENSQKDTILCANNGISFIDYLENQIKSLKGEE